MLMAERNTAPIRSTFKSEIDTWPDEVFIAVWNYAHKEKKRAHIPAFQEKAPESTREERRKAYEFLTHFPKRLPADFDYKRELLEALDKKYGCIDGCID
jgi:hypothetical protein